MYISFYLAVQWGVKLHLTIHLLGPLSSSLHSTGARCPVPACSWFCFGYYCKYTGRLPSGFSPPGSSAVCSSSALTKFHTNFHSGSSSDEGVTGPFLLREHSGWFELGGVVSVQPLTVQKDPVHELYWNLLNPGRFWFFPPSVSAVSCFCCFSNAESKLS